MRLIVNFNRHAFEQFGFDGYDRVDIDAHGQDCIMMCLTVGDDEWMAFSPCNDGENAKDGERERYKVRVPANKAEECGLEGSSRYSVEDDPGNPGFFFLKKHSLIIAGQPESYKEPMASVSFTEVEDNKRAVEEAIRKYLAGGDPRVIMNTLRLRLQKIYGYTGCWLKGNNGEPSVCLIRPWSTGASEEEQRELLMDENNVWLLRPDLQRRFANGDFSVDDNGRLIFSKGVDPVKDCGFNAMVFERRGARIMFGKLNRDSLTEEMKEYFRWHRKNIFRG